MTYAYVVAGTVQSTGNIPQTWRLLDGRWCSGFDLRPDLWQAQGWLPLTENRPAVTSAQTYGTPVFTVGASAVTADYPVVSKSALELANQTQDAATANLLSGAAALVTDLQNQATTYAAARGTLTTAIGNLPASPTVAQISTFIKGPLATYLGTDNDVTKAVGGDLLSTVKGLANDIARRSGSTASASDSDRYPTPSGGSVVSFAERLGWLDRHPAVAGLDS